MAPPSKVVTKAVEPDYAYLKMRCDPKSTDAITWKLVLTTLITRFAGIHGSAVPLDLMWIGELEDHSEAIVRCPAADAQLVSAGISGGECHGCCVRLIKMSNWMPMLL